MISIGFASANAQLNIKTSSSKEDLISKDMYCCVRGDNDDSYFLITTDKLQNTNAVLKMFLGKGKDSALLTLVDLFNWFNEAENKSSAVVTDALSGEELTLYRVSQGTYIITNGDAEYARRTYNQATTNALLGGARQRNNSASPIVGYVSNKVLKEAISKLSTF